MTFFCKAEYLHVPSAPPPDIHLRETWYIVTGRHKIVHSSTRYDSKELETTWQPSWRKWADEHVQKPFQYEEVAQRRQDARDDKVAASVNRRVRRLAERPKPRNARVDHTHDRQEKHRSRAIRHGRRAEEEERAFFAEGEDDSISKFETRRRALKRARKQLAEAKRLEEAYKAAYENQPDNSEHDD